MKIKKAIFIFSLFFVSIAGVNAKTIRTCTYEDTMNKVVIKVDDNYNAKAYRYGFDNPSSRWDEKPYEHNIENWDSAVKDALKSKNACPKYIVQGQKLNSIDWSVKTWVYYNKDKRDNRLEEFNHWYAKGTTTTISKDSGANNGGSIVDKDDGTGNVENDKKENIKEFKKTYKIGKFSNLSSGNEVIFYTKYNFTTNDSLTTQLIIPDYNGTVGFIYNGDVNSFKKNIINPIVNSNIWPENIYCGKLSATLKVSPSATTIIGTSNNGDVVCSNEKENFIDSNNSLAGFETNNDKKDKCEDSGIGGCIPDSPDKKVEEKDLCFIFNDQESVDFVKKIVGYLQIGSIFLVLILGILDFVGAISSDKDNAFKEAGKRFLNRLIAIALIFLVPAILGIILNFISVANDCNIEIFG